MRNGLITFLVIVVLAVAGWAVWVSFNEEPGIEDTTNTGTTNTDTTNQQSQQPQDVSDEATEPQAENTVTYDGSSFSPSTITVSPGTTVTFVNGSGSMMWVASDEHPSHQELPDFDANRGYGRGGEYSHTFEQTGSWDYHNHLNPSHTGTVVVEE